MSVEGGEKVGENVIVNVTDGGLPANGTIIVTAPDGSRMQYAFQTGKLEFTPDKPGVWTVTYIDSDGNTVTKTVTVAAASEPSPPAPVITPEPTPVVKAQGEFPWLIIAALAAIGILALFFFMTKGKKSGRK
jgi:hypothetical protein